VHAAWLASEEGRVIEYTRTMMVRERAVWLTDHPGATVEAQLKMKPSGRGVS
jgi:hypothetical protein